MLVGLGHVLGRDGALGYFYDKRSPIQTADGVVWRHLIRVDWEDVFQEIPYKDRSANTTVLSLDEQSLLKASALAKRAGYRKHGLSGAKVDLALGLEEAYPRATPGIIRLIVPKHIHLSRAFQGWLRAQHAIESRREVQQVDMEFMVGSEGAMVEFKIAYNQKTKPAVREALGQILEYNHYPKREATKMWFLVLDELLVPTTVRLLRHYERSENFLSTSDGSPAMDSDSILDRHWDKTQPRRIGEQQYRLRAQQGMTMIEICLKCDPLGLIPTVAATATLSAPWR